MKKPQRIAAIILLTPILTVIIYFLTLTSKDIHWGGGFWETWLAAHFHLNIQSAHLIVFWIRKTIHFTGYGSLGLLFWLYFYLWRVKKSLLTGLVATLLVAGLDEYLQSLSSFRSGKIQDVILDIIGAIIACGAVKLIKQVKG